MRIFKAPALLAALTLIASGGRLTSAGPAGAYFLLSGVVRDARGTGLPGAAVTMKNIGTDTITETQTNGTGNWAAPGISPGVYSITISLRGFKSVRYDHAIFVRSMAGVNINTVLEPGEPGQVVVITVMLAHLIDGRGDGDVTTTIVDDPDRPATKADFDALRALIPTLPASLPNGSEFLDTRTFPMSSFPAVVKTRGMTRSNAHSWKARFRPKAACTWKSC